MSNLSVRQNIFMSFPDTVLNVFHGFSVRSLPVADHLKGRLFRRLSRLDYSIWSGIFHYLTPKEIFSFVISSKKICTLFQRDMNRLRNEYILLSSRTRHDNFIFMIERFSPLVRLSCLKVQSSCEFILSDCEFMWIVAQRINYISLLHVRAPLSTLVLRPPQWISNIVELHLSVERLTIDDMGALLFLLKSLKALSIDGLYLPAAYDDLRLKGASFGSLEKFLCHESQMGPLVFYLLPMFPNLRELNLYGIGDNYQPIPTCALQNLRRLNLAKASLSGQESLRILAEARHLEYLNLSETEIETGTFSDLQADSLPALRELVLNSTAISGLDFIRFLMAANHLQIARAQYCSEIHKKVIFQSFPHIALDLQRVFFHGSRPRSSFMKKLLDATPSLIELALSPPGIPLPLRIKSVYLPYLKHLVLFEIKLTLTRLGLFLTSALLLEELRLIACEALHKGSLALVPEEACRELKWVDFARTPVRQDTVQFFRERTNNLTYESFDTLV